MNLKKENIIKHIKKIRIEIGHSDSDIKIQKLIFDENKKELWIITPDRPDKSAIIGKGGWVVGRLKEETNLNKIHVESYSDFLLKEYRLKLSLDRINSFIKEKSEDKLAKNSTNSLKKNPLFIKPMENLKFLLEEKIENIFSFNLENYFVNINRNNENNNDENKSEIEYKSIVALSGGVDSSFSLILAEKLGFDPLAITVNPGTIILPKQFKNNVEKLCNDINVDHKYINVDYNEIIKNSLNGRFHPCGRCSSIIESTIFDYAEQNNINIVIFGDMLSTGYQCITKHITTPEKNKINANDMNSEERQKEIYRLNLPATISIGKQEIRNTVSRYNLDEIKGFGCPLLYETHKKYPYLRKFSIQRILRETRAGVLEPGESLDLIWSFTH